MTSYLNSLLEPKVTNTTEIELHLFEYCNLKCSFCSAKTDDKTGLDQIREKAYTIVDYINKTDKQEHTVNIMAGEIFQDGLPESVFDDYLFLYNHVNDHCKLNNKTVRFNFVTNLIFTENTPKVEELFNKMGDNAFISTSYDFTGRGLDINRTLAFKSNLNRFKSKIGVVGFVLTKPSIKRMLKTAKEDSFFNYLYDNFPLYFDYYVPEKSVDKMMPSDKEMLEAFHFIANHYPNVEPIKSLLENETNQMTCFSLNKTTILPDNSQVVCRYLKYENDQFLTPVDYSSNENIIETYLDRYNCLSCQYYNRCQFRCFVQADWNQVDRLPNNQCYIKQFLIEQGV